MPQSKKPPCPDCLVPVHHHESNCQYLRTGWNIDTGVSDPNSWMKPATLLESAVAVHLTWFLA